MTSDGIFWSVTWFIVVCGIVGLAGVSKGCVERQQKLKHDIMVKAVENHCIFLDTKDAALICDLK